MTAPTLMAHANHSVTEIIAVAREFGSVVVAAYGSMTFAPPLLEERVGFQLDFIADGRARARRRVLEPPRRRLEPLPKLKGL